jgi:hypothetical protein
MPWLESCGKGNSALVTVAATLLDGRYSLDEQIGAGGFCEVWRATDVVLMRPVAVKLLHAGYADQPEARARFKAEARYAGALSHKNIARVYDYGEPARGQFYLVMELMEGPSLACVLAGGPLDAARTMDVVAQVAAGLQAAHSVGLIHRDIKPTNVVFTSGGTARITDFGIAHVAGSVPLTATGMVLGTPAYMAPERIAGAQAGPASDLYSLGIVAYECLAGARPFSGSPLDVAMAHRDRPLPPLPASLPAEVVAFVMMLTAKDPASRPASAEETAWRARRLRGHLMSGAIGARPVPAGALTITGAAGSRGRGTVRSRARARRPRTRTGRARPGIGRARRPLTVGAAGVVALAALTCLALLTIARLSPPAHPAAQRSSPPPQAAPTAAKSPPGPSPVPAQPAGKDPSAASNSGDGAVTAVMRPPARHPAPQPGPPRHGNRPASTDGPGPANGPGSGNGPANGPGSGNGPANGPGSGPEKGPGSGNAHGAWTGPAAAVTAARPFRDGGRSTQPAGPAVPVRA